MSPAKFSKFLLVKLPIAWLAGVRLQQISDTEATTTVKLHRMSQNPFRSIFWAVQGMAAELSTGVQLFRYMEQSGRQYSMLVTEQQAFFSKKAVGRCEFTCTDGELLRQAMEEAFESKTPQSIRVSSVGTDESGDRVSEFFFTWSIKARDKQK
ncbi:MAG: DUF4442 domain-containing protein [Weeksellaceae bacterium]|nr:DUF4442 domain-containing protein [Weeksellaceae bacterium]